MIVVLKDNSPKQKIDKLLQEFERLGLKNYCIKVQNKTLIGLVGDTYKVDINMLKNNDIVLDVKIVPEPYKTVNRKFHPQDTVIKLSNAKIGDKYFGVIAGPCSIESEQQIIETAKAVKNSGANFLRGGAFKPRTSPYTFQGLMNEGLKLLLKAKEVTNMPIVTEIMGLSYLDLFEQVDIIQVGARNMQNFELLKELGHCNKPILLKRGLANTIEELLMSAEYIMAGGNNNIILCERGIRTFETAVRNTLDLSSIPILKKATHLPVIVDPSHATGLAELVKPMSKASIACGADGLMIEVHNNPKKALCDGAQSLTPTQFQDVMQSIKPYIHLENKQM